MIANIIALFSFWFISYIYCIKKDFCEDNFFGHFDAAISWGENHYLLRDKGHRVYKLRVTAEAIGGLKFYDLSDSLPHNEWPNGLTNREQESKVYFTLNDNRTCSYLADKTVMCSDSNITDNTPLNISFDWRTATAFKTDNALNCIILTNGHQDEAFKIDIINSTMIISSCSNDKNSSIPNIKNLDLTGEQTLIGFFHIFDGNTLKTLVAFISDNDNRIFSTVHNNSTWNYWQVFDPCKSKENAISILYMVLSAVYFTIVFIYPLMYLTQAFSESKQNTTIATDESTTEETKSDTDKKTSGERRSDSQKAGQHSLKSMPANSLENQLIQELRMKDPKSSERVTLRHTT